MVLVGLGSIASVAVGVRSLGVIGSLAAAGKIGGSAEGVPTLVAVGLVLPFLLAGTALVCAGQAPDGKPAAGPILLGLAGLAGLQWAGRSVPGLDLLYAASPLWPSAPFFGLAGFLSLADAWLPRRRPRRRGRAPRRAAPRRGPWSKAALLGSVAGILVTASSAGVMLAAVASAADPTSKASATTAWVLPSLLNGELGLLGLVGACQTRRDPAAARVTMVATGALSLLVGAYLCVLLLPDQALLLVAVGSSAILVLAGMRNEPVRRVTRLS